METIAVNEAIVVEGHYDVMKLREIVSSVVVETGGFAIFKDKEIQNLLIDLAHKRGLIILTDSDSAGFKIRAFVSQLVPKECVKHAFIPEIVGVEKRKSTPSKSNLIGVEGVERRLLKEAILSVTNIDVNEYEKFDTALLYSLGLSGQKDSSIKRRSLLKELGLPSRLSSGAMCRILPYMLTVEQLRKIVAK